MTKTTRIVVVLIAVAIAVAAFIYTTSTTTSRTEYGPNVGALRLMSATLTAKQAYCRDHPEKCLTTQHTTYYKIATYKQPAMRIAATTGMETCYVWGGKHISGNWAFDEVVSAWARFHACTRDGGTTFSRTWFTTDHWERWLGMAWNFTGYDVKVNTTGWCTACMSERHTWRLKFHWYYGVVIGGQHLGYNHTSELSCTVRLRPYITVGNGLRWECGNFNA